MRTEDLSLQDISAPPVAGIPAAPAFAVAEAIRHVRMVRLAELSRTDLVVGAIILGLFSVVFVIDLFTPTDRFVVCFLYSTPLFLALAGHNQPVYFYASIATTFALLNVWLALPLPETATTFAATRSFGIAAVWIAAALMAWRKHNEALVRSQFEHERQKAESRGEFLDLLSHEVGSSLTAIEGQAFCLRRLSGPSTAGDVAVRAEKIHNSVHQIKTMVERIQTASEAGERCLRARNEPFDLRGLVSDVLQQAAATYPERTIEATLGDLPQTLQGDRCMLKQVITNLLSNALKYSAAPSLVTVEGRSEDDHAVLSVRDRGRGIAESDRDRLFAPYFRGSNSRGVPGSGIGLYVCERFVESHRGTIAIESQLGIGTTVTVRLPIAPLASDSRNAVSHPLH